MGKLTLTNIDKTLPPLGIMQAIIGLIIANLILTFGDVAVKAIGSVGGLFQYLLLRQLLTISIVAPFWHKLPRLKKEPGALAVHTVRAHIALLGGACALYSLLNLSLATANVIFYAAPLVTLLLARLWLKQALTSTQTTQVLLGFLGVIIALQPDDIGWAALSAITVAFTLAFYNLLTCKLPKQQSMRNMVFWSQVTAVPLTALLAFIFWQPIEWVTVQLAIIVALTSCIYQVVAAKAYQHNDAGDIVSAEYAGLVFALILGIFYFDEAAYSHTIIGIMLIILPIVWQSLRLYPQKKYN